MSKMFADCCHVMIPATPKDVSVRKKFQKPKANVGPNRIVNVGIGSLAAGEVTFAEVQPPSPATSNVKRPSSPMAYSWNNFSKEAKAQSVPTPFGKKGGGSEAPVPAPKGAGAAPARPAEKEKPVGNSNAAPLPLEKNGDEDDNLMPFKHKNTNNVREMGRRKSIACMEGYLVGGGKTSPSSGSKKTKEPTDLNVGDQVIRGPSWCWGEEDGGPDNVGTVVAIDRRAQRIQVTWRLSEKTHNHYRCGVHKDLLLAPGYAEQQPKHSSEGTSEEADEDEDADRPARGREAVGRRVSKELFAHPTQTFIVLDWDDTLFPTTYVRDDLGLCWQTPMRNQRLDPKEKAEVTRNLEKCAENCCALLRSAVQFGKVVLVTLARSPWVSVSCEHFFPAVGSLIRELGVPIIYAQEGAQTEYNKTEMSSNENIEMHWSKVKGRAIAKEIGMFYSQYAGQSWKNIISIGDSDFERLGTMQATDTYMKQTGICRQKTVEVSGHIYKVRTKTFKMLDLPSVDELTVELAMVQKWLPLMIQLDGSFDVNLDDLEDPVTLRRIERTLKG